MSERTSRSTEKSNREREDHLKEENKNYITKEDSLIQASTAQNDHLLFFCH